MRKLLICLGFGFAALSLAACNTIAGVGEDLQSAGNAIQNAADDAKD